MCVCDLHSFTFKPKDKNKIQFRKEDPLVAVHYGVPTLIIKPGQSGNLTFSLETLFLFPPEDGVYEFEYHGSLSVYQPRVELYRPDGAKEAEIISGTDESTKKQFLYDGIFTITS